MNIINILLNYNIDHSIFTSPQASTHVIFINLSPKTVVLV